MAGQTYATFAYTSDAAKKYPIRISDKSLAVNTGATSGGYDDGNVKVSVSHHGQKRRTGIQARGWVIGLPTVDSQVNYSAITFVPILTPTLFNSKQKGADVTYDGNTWKLLDKVGEV